MELETAIVLVLAYLLGSFPTARLVAGRWGHDPGAEGSGNPGASNVYRVAGRRAGALVFVGDIAKGALAAGAGLAVGGRALGIAAGIAAVLGHTLPPWRHKGGKGVATSAGMVMPLYPLFGLGAVGLWLLIARLAGRASVASLAVAVVLPVAIAVVEPWEGAAMAGLSAYIVARHASNIRRLLAGEERSLRG